MVAVNKEVCANLMRKGKWDKVMCGLCIRKQSDCEVYDEYLDRVREMNSDAFDERREMAQEGVEDGD